ncbi:MAG: hypothetical protein Q9226_005279 [Calogaya cf. arnoldii]
MDSGWFRDAIVEAHEKKQRQFNHRLSSIPESMFFEYAYDEEDASIASGVIFEGRRPKNLQKAPPVTRRQVPGWEGVEEPVYVPGQLVGWDCNWQGAPGERGRRTTRAGSNHGPRTGQNPHPFVPGVFIYATPGA